MTTTTIIIIAATVYVVVGLAIFFVPALFGEKDPSDWGTYALIWPIAIVIGVPLLLYAALTDGIDWIFTTLFTKLSNWAQDRKRKKSLQERLAIQEAKLERLDVEFPPLEPADYRHMNCTSCGHAIDKDHEKEI